VGGYKASWVFWVGTLPCPRSVAA